MAFKGNPNQMPASGSGMAITLYVQYVLGADLRAGILFTHQKSDAEDHTTSAASNGQ